MKRHVSNLVFNTDTKSLQCWFSSLLKQVFTAKVCVRNHHTPKTNLCIYKCSYDNVCEKKHYTSNAIVLMLNIDAYMKAIFAYIN